MTANDIADMVEKEPYHTNLNRSTIAYFIRQQQAEIEVLKADNKRLKGYCWETDEAIEFLKTVKEAQEK